MGYEKRIWTGRLFSARNIIAHGEVGRTIGETLRFESVVELFNTQIQKSYVTPNVYGGSVA
jgi:hypothetical protein